MKRCAPPHDSARPKKKSSRKRISVARAALPALVLCFAAACSTPPPIETFQLQGQRLTINNRTPDDWRTVEVWINRQYRITAPEIRAGQRFDATVDAFLDAYGNHFYYNRQQIKDVHLTATSARGTPVDLHMEFPRSGLTGLADSGVFKKKEKP